MESPANASSTDVRRLVARLRFRHLELLVELERRGSLRAAAVVLNLTQPALSKALIEIESAFGFALFVRNARGLAATARGAVAIQGAKRLLAELSHVRAEAALEPAALVLRIGAPPFVAQGYLPAILAGLVAGERPVLVELHEERVRLLTSHLLDGRLDVLVTSHPADPADLDRSLQAEKLFDADFEVIAPIDHPLGRARRVDWHRLARERWILPATSAMVRRILDDRFRLEGAVAPTPTIESTSPVTNVQLVAAGVGLSVVPGATLRAGHGVGRIRRVRVHPPIPSNPVALVYRVASDRTRVDLLRDAIRRGARA